MIANATYSTGERVYVHGKRNGFTYIQFTEPGRNYGLIVKVPESWVTED